MDQYTLRQSSYSLHFCKKTQPSLMSKISLIKHYLELKKLYKKLLKKKRNLEKAKNSILPQLNFFLDRLLKAHMILEYQNFYEELRH